MLLQKFFPYLVVKLLVKIVVADDVDFAQVLLDVEGTLDFERLVVHFLVMRSCCSKNCLSKPLDSEGDPHADHGGLELELRCTGRRVLAPAWATWRCVAQSSFWFLWLPCCLCGVQRRLEDAELPHWPSHVEEQGWSVLEVPDLEGGSEAGRRRCCMETPTAQNKPWPIAKQLTGQGQNVTHLGFSWL